MLPQGGCMALEDAVTLAATLRDASRANGAGAAAAFADAEPAALAAALRGMERQRTARCAPLVQMAHDNGERMCLPKSLPVRGPQLSCRRPRPGNAEGDALTHGMTSCHPA